ncbi:MAG: glycoside hydrolase family 3 C-terminal domain-containing protein, partial [Bacteroidaceae bacterium]|nr:glycoside hydrolase family 3 C-terminal domain-containing protein [Bacteroidaceae bacterium]
MKKSIFLLAASMFFGLTYAQQTDPLLQHETEITEIIKSMTLEEKVNMLHGKNMFSSAGIERLGIADMEYADGPFGIREEMEPHSWMPLGWETDRATFFPTGSALAATWSPEIAYEYGKGMAIEAKLRGKDMILGPAMNIQRLPTGGRTYEYLSEDPILSGELAVGYTLGSQDMNEAVCLKHFAVNSQENMRGFVNANISERALREIYLTPFEMAVKKAKAMGVMAAYNKVWGTWCSENFNLQNNILRNEWGFKGMIISDWGGTHSTIGAALGGLEVEMPGSTYMGDSLIAAVNKGDVPMEVIDAKVRNILRVRLAIQPVPKDVANTKVTSQPETQAIAYKVASKSIVLLKNEGVLPLSKKVKTIAVIGDNATRTMGLGGVGAGVKTLYEVTPLEGLQKALKGKAKINYARGYEPAPQARWGQKLPENAMEEYEKRMEVLKKEALKVAKRADLVLFIGGDNREVETEGSDRTSIDLPFDQEDLLEDIAEVNPNVVVVMVAGAPVDLREVEPIAKGLVYSWFNGTEGGNALADVLTGKIAPSGKLPFTLPKKLEDSPAYALGVYPQQEQGGGDVFVNLVNRDRFAVRKADADYSEGIFVGYRWYTTKNVEPMYAFGHGLSYVPFKYANLNAKVEDESIEVTFDLANQGAMEADEVAQVYIARPESKVERPKYELKGFKRVAVKAGETTKVTISIPKEQLRHWNEFQHAWNVENGKAVIYVGGSSDNLPL